MKAETIPMGNSFSSLFAQSADVASMGDDFSLLRSELELVIQEDAQLLKIAGAAALFVSQLEGMALPRGAMTAAAKLARLIGEMSDDTLCEAMQSLNG